MGMVPGWRTKSTKSRGSEQFVGKSPETVSTGAGAMNSRSEYHACAAPGASWVAEAPKSGRAAQGPELAYRRPPAR